MKNYNTWFVTSILSLVFIAPFGAVKPLIALVAIIISGVFFAIWYIKEMEEQEKEESTKVVEADSCNMGK